MNVFDVFLELLISFLNIFSAPWIRGFTVNLFRFYKHNCFCSLKFWIRGSVFSMCTTKYLRLGMTQSLQMLIVLIRCIFEILLVLGTGHEGTIMFQFDVFLFSNFFAKFLWSQNVWLKSSEKKIVYEILSAFHLCLWHML